MSPADRRRSIVTAALPLLRTKGVQVSTAEIAQAAGVAEGTLFRVFACKDDIVHAVIDDVMDPANVNRQLAAIDLQAPLAERMMAIVQILHGRIADISFLMSALHASGMSHTRPKHTRAQHEAHAASLRDAIADVLAPDADHLRETPGITASLLRSIAFATAHPLLSDGVVTDPCTIVDLFLHGLLDLSPAQDHPVLTPGQTDQHGDRERTPEGDRTC